MLYTKPQAHSEITDLVASFRANERILANVPEAQIESNYIRKLFRFLNWNTENTGLSVAEWEFVLQRTDEKGKRPDYLLQLDGQQVLVMDAKKVKYDMHDPRWMTQVYAYAYSTQSQPTPRKIDFAILTDFQEFILLDCTLYATDPKVVNNFRILDWRYEDYVSQFDTLWELLERENVRSALKTRGDKNPSGLSARYLSPKKVKANRIPPDKTFLSVMDDENTGWRVRLAKDMKKHNPQADGPLITAAVQLLIDRLIFVKALSDREIEADYLTQLAEKVEKSGLDADDAGWFNACRDIFARLNQFYDGSIFEPRPELEAVTVSNKLVRSVIHDLQPENSPYNFAVLPVEILGTIYERFLGRVVRATDQRVKIEDKPEVRKAGGVYYTPQYIVDYIVEHTVGKLLSECKTPADVARLKILDPACGSGSFLIGAYTALIHWHEAYYGDKEHLTQRDREAAYYDSDGRVRLTARLKRQILLNNLYGVDIDAQAVEVTRFSLSLKALEDTRRAELYEERTLFQQTVLPDLRQNIKCGNSLIGNDYSLLPLERMVIHTFEWKDEFQAVMTAGGFDAVISNPPYIRIQTLQETNPVQVAYLKTHYRSAGSGNYDIYVVFVEKGLNLLNERGRLGFILPHKFFNAKYGEALRGLIAEGQHLSHVVHFGDQQVFEGATTYTTLMFLAKGGSEQFEVVKVKDLERWRAGQRSSETPMPSITGTIPATAVTTAEWNFTVGKGAALFERLMQMPVNLENVTSRIFQGIKTSADKIYIVEERDRQDRRVRVYSPEKDAEYWLEPDLLHPLIKGGDSRRYSLSRTNRLILFPYAPGNDGTTALIPDTSLKSRYSLTWDYLLDNKTYLENREHGKMRGKKWYGYVYPKALDVISLPKIFTPDIAMHSSFSLDETGDLFFTGGVAGGYGILVQPSYSREYILGLLNSRLLEWINKQSATQMRGGYYSFESRFIRTLPIYIPTAAEKVRHDRMVRLVEAMLELHQYKAKAKTQTEQEQLQRQLTATDRQIDELVYELYDLTPEEIAVVEGQK
jgi:hypothetical protein